MQTHAEVLFEKFCTQRHIAYARIPEAQAKTPDYEIVLGGHSVAVEVKQLEPNDGDRAFFEDLRTKGRAGGSENMGRARSAMHDALKQLRPYAHGRMPGVILLYNTMGTVINYLDPYNLAFCLYGPEKVNFAVPADPSLEVEGLGLTRGGGSIATKQHNTTLSAVAVLSEIGREDGLEVRVYHNVHAAIPLAPEQCEAHGIPQYRFAPNRTGEMPEWIAC